MKRAVSISIGSSKRNKAVEVQLLGETVSIERIGTDGDMEAAALKYKELDGKVDAFGVGGADLGTYIEGNFYPYHSVQKMVRYIEKTPVVDGGGLKNTLENKAPSFLEKTIGGYVQSCGRKVMLPMGLDRWGLSKTFAEAGYETTFCDWMFALGVPIAIHSLGTLRFVAKTFVPLLSRLPFEMLYPTGEKQETREPKYVKWYEWATVVAGDCHYIKKHMPDNMQGKVIVTNTTTPEDVALFKKCGVKYLVTTTPVLDGRSFGTNMMEAALVAISGKGRPLTFDELDQMLDKLGFEPQLQELN
jgi:hypothetical protein